MAYLFDGITDRVDLANVWDFSTGGFTAAFWIDSDNSSNNQTFWIANASGDTVHALRLWGGNGANQNRMRFEVNTDGTTHHRLTLLNTIPSSGFGSVIVTWTGVVAGGTSHIYVDGTEASYDSSADGSGTADAHSGLLSFGGASFEDTTTWQGKMAEVAFWDRVLTATERGIYDNGYSALFIPDGLRIYLKDGMVRDTPHNYVSGETATLDGTTVTEHPRVIYPSGPIVGYTAAAVPIYEQVSFRFRNDDGDLGPPP